MKRVILNKTDLVDNGAFNEHSLINYCSNSLKVKKSESLDISTIEVFFPNKCTVCKSSNIRQLDYGWWCKSCKKPFIQLNKRSRSIKPKKILNQNQLNNNNNESTQNQPQINNNNNNNSNFIVDGDNHSTIRLNIQPFQLDQQQSSPQKPTFLSLLQTNSLIPFSPNQIKYPKQSPTFDPLFHPFPLESNFDPFFYQEFAISSDSLPCSNF